MCTVTLICNERGGARLVTNRDESPQRPRAIPPRIQRYDSMLAAMPTDPEGGGSWVCVNSSGLIATLLNLNSGNAERGECSRGLIVRDLSACDGMEEALVMCGSIETRNFSPFRVLVWDAARAEGFVWRSDQTFDQRQTHTRESLPIMLASSGLGDHLADPPRRSLFHEYLQRGDFDERRQDAFHRHVWADHGAQSVLMSRADARTVSICEVEVGPQGGRMRYREVDANRIVGDAICVDVPRLVKQT